MIFRTSPSCIPLYMKPLLFIIFLFSLPFAVFAQQNTMVSSQQTSEIKGNTYALVVGISHYGNGIESLQYANRDAAVFADFLRSKAGGSVPSENIRFLQDSTASSGALYEGLYWLTKVAKENDLVYIYFSGHGDIDGDLILKNGYLLCYNSPPSEYINFALSVSNLNEYANTLSAGKKANVVLITDACHSDKISSAENRGPLLEGLLGKETEKKEVRISSCQADELSAENEAWGGGRGVFSYYLVNGLKGLADKSKDGVVTLEEIKNYMSAAFAGDALIQREKIKQTPSLKGSNDFIIAKVDETAAADAAKEINEGQQAIPIITTNPFTFENTSSAQDYFFELLSGESIEELTNKLDLYDQPADSVVFQIIRNLKRKSEDNTANEFYLKSLRETVKNIAALPAQIAAYHLSKLQKAIEDSTKRKISTEKLNELLTILTDTNELTFFKDRLAVSFDDKGQEVINQYLSGDAAELEKRRYYNADNNGYDLYKKIFAIAIKLSSPGNIFFQNILKVKYHYFGAVAARVRIPLEENPASLLDTAWREIQAAVKLEDSASYIYNELGNIYDLKKDYLNAEKCYLRAIKKTPDWAIPWSNLASLKLREGKVDQVIVLLDSAKKRQPNLQSIDVGYGLAYEKKGNLLLAEELFSNAIKINTRHYLPFERLGYIYTNTTAYAKADSFFYEGDQRKKGFHFSEGIVDNMDKEANTPSDPPCVFDSANIKKDDPVGQTVWGIMDLNSGNLLNAEKHFKTAIALDKSNPLAFHYLGKLLFRQQRWQEAEIIFKLAEGNYLDRESFIIYIDSIKKKKGVDTNADCNYALFAFFGYYQIEDYFFLGTLYKKWGHFTEASNEYKKIIKSNPAFIGGYHQLWTLMEFLGRNADAENVLLDYINYTIQHFPDHKENRDPHVFTAFITSYSDGYRELYAFYRRMIKQFPGEGSWYYKQGVLLYNLAETHKEEEAYSENEKESRESENRNVFEQPDIYADETFINKEYTDKAILPGINEQIDLSPDIRYPYSEEGIAYLKKADSILGSNINTHAEINERTGDLFLWLGLPDLASSHYKIAVDTRPDNATTRERLVETYAAAGQLQNALSQLDSLYRRKEINFNKLVMLAEYKIHSGLFTEAQAILNNAEKIHPYIQNKIIDLNGRLQSLSLHNKEALIFYQQLLKGNEKDNMIMFTIARLYARSGKTTEAWKWLEAALQNGFNYSFVLKYDQDMNALRKNNKWKNLMDGFKPRTYLSKTDRSKVDGN